LLKKKPLKAYYEEQNSLIDTYMDPTATISEEDELKMDGKIRFAVRASMVANVLLFCMQLIGAIWSHSLSLISTTIDAFMDILSNAILLFTDIAKRKRNPLLYPVGKSRMEPLGVILFASMMSFMSLEIIQEAATALINQDDAPINVDVVPIVLVSSAIFIKICLYIYCRVLTSPTGEVLAQDHRNDVVLNCFGLGMAILGSRVKWWIDPMGGICIALLILRSWASTAFEQIQLLAGKGVDKPMLQKFVFIAMHHDQRITKVDTCRAFYVGAGVYVEMDIVLPPDMPLKETHDIGESLQKTLEGIAEVERAFVHVDYEYSHKAEDEHKLV